MKAICSYDGDYTLIMSICWHILSQRHGDWWLACRKILFNIYKYANLWWQNYLF